MEGSVEGHAERMMIKEALRRLDAAIQDAIVARNMIEYTMTETAQPNRKNRKGPPGAIVQD